MEKYILILGASIMQKPAIKIAKEMGLKVIATDQNKNAMCKDMVDIFENIDLRDQEAHLKMAKEYWAEGKLNGVITVGTDFSRTVAYITQELLLPGISYETARNVTFKDLMREKLKKAGVQIPKFTIIKKEDSVLDLNLSYPIVVKPTDNMGARGVSMAYSDESLKKAIENASKFLKESDNLIIEELITDPEYSIDSLVYKGNVYFRGVAIRHIKYPPCFIEIGHTLPAELEKKDLDRMKDEFQRAVFALGIDIGAAKGDVFYSRENGLTIGEIAGRLSGGYMSGWTYPYASGVSAIKDAIKIAIGETPEFKKEYKEYTSAERGLLSIDGSVKKIRILKENRYMIEHKKEVFLNVKEDDIVNFPKNNVEKCGNVIFSARNRNFAIESVEEEIKSILIELKESKRTDAYLISESVNWNYEFSKTAFTKQKYNIKYTSGTIKKSKYIFYPLDATEMNFEEKDFSFRSLRETLNKITLYFEVSFLPYNAEDFGYKDYFFWKFTFKGGLQGAFYYFEKLNNNPEDFANFL